MKTYFSHFKIDIAILLKVNQGKKKIVFRRSPLRTLGTPSWISERTTAT